MKNLYKTIISGLLFSFLLLVIAGCTLKNPATAKFPSWDLTLQIPLIKQDVTLKEIAKDSLITEVPIGANGDSILAFRDTVNIDTVEIGNQLNIGDINKSFTQTVNDVTVGAQQKKDNVAFEEIGVDDVTKHVSSEVGPVELNDTDPQQTDPFLFSEIMPSLYTQMNQTIQNNGGSATFDSIPGTDLSPQTKPFVFESFKSATFSSGFIDMTINNNMFIPLGSPFTVTLLDRDMNVIDVATYTNPIPTNGSATKSLDISGKSLTDSVYVKVAGHSNGSSGQSQVVTESELNTGFTVEIQARDMVATQAKAQIPSQQISESDIIPLNESQNKVQSATLKSGSLVLDIENNLSVASTIVLTIPSLVDDQGAEFQTSIPLPPNQATHDESDISNYKLQMDINQQEVQYSYEIQTEDTGTDYATINQNDSVNVDIQMTNMTFSQITGRIKSQHISKNGDIPITSDSEILKATIQEGAINVSIDNRIGGDATVTLTIHQIFESPGSPDTLQRVLNITDGVNDETIDLSGKEIRLSRDNQAITYTTITVTDSGQFGTFNLEDSIDVNIDLTEMTFSKITGYFNQEAIVSRDTISLNNNTKVHQALIDSGRLELRIANKMGVQARVKFTIDEFVDPDGNIFTDTLTLPESGETITRSIPLRNYTIEMPLDTQYIHYQSRIALSQNDSMTIDFNKSMQVQVNVLDISFQEVQGIIDPVTVDMNPVEQEITAFPEAMDNINFKKVNMKIDFDTNIGIPVILNLTLQSGNDVGDSATIQIQDWDITDSNTVIIPRAERLINLNPKPNIIIAKGRVVAGQPGVEGTVAQNQYVLGQLQMSAPLEFQIGDSSTVSLDPELVDASSPKQIQGVTVYADMDNQFEFGALVEVFASQDTNDFQENSLTKPDTLATLNLPPKSVTTDSIVLDQHLVSLFQDSIYLKTQVHLLSNTDASGNPVSSRFLSTDSLHLTLYGTLRYLNDQLANLNQ